MNDTGKAGWKLDDKGNVVLNNGNPVYIKEDGSESVIEVGTISRLNGEAKANRERAERAEEALKNFKDIDPAKAKEALETIKKIDQKKLIDAGEIDKVRDEVAKGYTSQIAERDTRLTAAEQKLAKLMLDNAFNGSQFVRERIAVPPEMFRTFFGANFRVEEDKIVPYNQSGNKIYSKKRMGELADFSEAIEILVEDYPHKDSILKAASHTGSGNGGGGGARGGSNVIKRADFDKLSPVEKSQIATKGEFKIVD